MESASSTRLVLIRHGESRATVDRVVGGRRGDQGLSELGRQQCVALRDRLHRSHEFDAVAALYSSDLHRAVETADIIAPAFGLSPANVVREGELRELDPGVGDGLHWEEFERLYGLPDMRADPYVRLAPDGESLAEFQVRVGTALTEVAGKHAGTTVVIACHGGVIDTAMVFFLGLARFGTYIQFSTANASINEWLLPAGGSDGWRLVRYNDIAHLHSSA
jgi:broad specificity phosphatase PhoE